MKCPICHQDLKWEDIKCGAKCESFYGYAVVVIFVCKKCDHIIGFGMKPQARSS